MKKLVFMFVAMIAMTMVSCGNKTQETITQDTTTIDTLDSTFTDSVNVDSVVCND